MCYVPASDPTYRRRREHRIALSWTVGIILPLAFWLLAERSGRLDALGPIGCAGGPSWVLWLAPWLCALAGVLISPQVWFRLGAGPILWLATLLNQCAACSAVAQFNDSPRGMQPTPLFSVDGGLMLDVGMAMLVLLAGLSSLGRLEEPKLPQDDGDPSAQEQAQSRESWGTPEMDERQLLLGL